MKVTDKGSPYRFLTTVFDWSGVKGAGSAASWIGSDLFVTLNRDVRAIVSLVTGGTHGTYSGLLVRLVNKREGEVDRRVFTFAEHLGHVARMDERVDGPHPYPARDPALNAAGPHTYSVVAHTGWDWYICEPETTQPLTDAVAAYLAVFA